MKVAREIASRFWLSAHERIDLERAIIAAIAAEREACAKIAEAWESCNHDGCASSIVDAIKSRNP